jgi:hypothetical protein
MTTCGCVAAPATVPMRRRMSGCGVIEITPMVVKTWVGFVKSKYDISSVVVEDVRIDIKRKGNELPVASYRAFSKDLDNKVSFYWDDLFLSAAPGYYVGDVYIADNYCLSLEFRIPRCTVEATGCVNEVEDPCMDTLLVGSGVCAASGLDIEEQ